MALVVYVFATVLMRSAGLRATLVATGQDDNVIVIRRGSQTEVQSGIDRAQASVVESLPDVAVGEDGRAQLSKEPVVLINLPKRASGKPSNVVIRGVMPRGLTLRPQMHIIEGRMFRPGTAAVIAAMITMYASVASRTAEIGTLRALGFSRTAILTAFLAESLLLGLLGGVLGLAGAAFMQALSISTTNFQTFAEVAFRFVLTP